MAQKERLNEMCPIGQEVNLGTRLDEILTLVRELHDDHATVRTILADLKSFVNTVNDTIDGILAKLDADAGVNDTDYASIWGTSGSDSNHAPVDITSSPPSALSASKPDALS